MSVTVCTTAAALGRVFSFLNLRTSVFLATLLFFTPHVFALSVDWLTIGNPNNSPDQDFGFGAYGAVSYTYLISSTEVTNDQYAEFLNSIAATDPNSVWNGDMEISRSGSDGSYAYTVNPGFGSHPINSIPSVNAMRFINWLENGQPTGSQDATTTEDGTYAISDGISEVRTANAKYFLPTENEWYKAAYHQPLAAGGDVDDYWFYPTQSNSVPTAEPPVGGANSANYGLVSVLTSVGSYANTTSFYGGFDFGGNVAEWNEDVFDGSRGLRGGSWFTDSLSLSALFRNPDAYNDGQIGFRVAGSIVNLVPEPSSTTLLIVGTLGTAIYSHVLTRRRR